MLLKLRDHIANCLERANAGENRASEATDPRLRNDNERIVQGLRQLARSYQFVESLERFLLDMDKARNSVPREPLNEKDEFDRQIAAVRRQVDTTRWMVDRQLQLIDSGRAAPRAQDLLASYQRALHILENDLEALTRERLPD